MNYDIKIFEKKGKMRRISVLVVTVFYISLSFVKSEALNDKKEWKAKWISTMECQSTTNTWLAYRKSVDIQIKPEKTIAKIAVDSKYWLWVNEKLVTFEGGLKRGPNPLDTYFDEVDIAPFLKTGKNTIAVLVWYFGKDGFSHKSSGRAGMIFDCQSPGFELISDASWKCIQLKAYQTAGLPLPNFRLSESSILYDSRKDIGQWQSTSYNEQLLPNAMILGSAGDAPWNNLFLRPIPFFKNSGLVNYVKEEANSFSQTNDTIICDLPYNAQITPYLKIESHEGQKIIICTDNYLKYNGGANIIRGEYITKEGIQEYESLGWMNGHKVYYIIPKGVKVLELKYRESGYDTEFVGNFHSSDPFFNKLWEKADRTLYLSMRDSYMDCPDRERAQWTGDAVHQMGESFYALSPSSHALSKKWLHEIIQWQRPDGSLFSPIPAGNWDKELSGQVLATIGYYGLWTYYLYTGDKQTTIDLYDASQRYLNLWELDSKGTMKLRQGDWLWGDWGEEKDIRLIYNLWYYLAVKGIYNVALELGKTDDAIKYEKFMAEYKTSFNSQFWNGLAYRDPQYKGKTDDRVQALAVVAGIADKVKYPALLKVFQTEEHASPFMEKYVFEAMMQMGYENEAMSRHQKRFNEMVNNPNFTTLFEAWGIGDKAYGGGTVNHAWSAGGLTILSQYVCGIAPLTPGFNIFKVMPQSGYLTEASATFESVKGIIKSSFKKGFSNFEVKLNVPTTTRAIVGIPIKSIKQIRLNGELIWGNGKYLKRIFMPLNYKEVGRICFEVPQGEWLFEAD